jgi:hypothetical protein
MTKEERIKRQAVATIRHLESLLKQIRMLATGKTAIAPQSLSLFFASTGLPPKKSVPFGHQDHVRERALTSNGPKLSF